MRAIPPQLAGILQWAILLSMPIFLTLASLYVVMTPQFIAWQYARPDFPPAQLFSPETRFYNAAETVRYTRGEISEQALVNLGVYNDREIKHLVDVYNVTRIVFWVEPLLLAVIAISLYVLLRGTGTLAYAGRGLFYGGLLTFAFIGAIGLFSLLAFDTFFVTFHRIFFEGDTWLFNYTDSLIQFYPVEFWMTAAYAIALIVLLGAVIVTAVGAWLMRRNRS
jgi:integral membrane protein (TIGR01906 family)